MEAQGLKVIGRAIIENGKTIGKIVGNRPHILDIYKGYEPDFAIIWNDGKRTDMRCYAYFKDVVRAVKGQGRNV